MIKKNKKFIIIFVITCVLFWGLLILIDYSELARAASAIILFPFAPLWMTFNLYCKSLNDPRCSLPINDEITEALLFLLFCIGQALVYYWLYNKCVMFLKNLKNGRS